jgi:hypothetical protein
MAHGCEREHDKASDAGASQDLHDDLLQRCPDPSEAGGVPTRLQHLPL